MKKHLGFAAAQSSIASKENLGKEAAGAILASATRKAGSKARMANPALNKVKGNPFSKAMAK